MQKCSVKNLAHYYASNTAYRLVYLLILFLTTSLLTFHAQNTQAKEFFLKATMLYRIANLIDWPPGVNNTHLQICILGDLDKRFMQALERFKPTFTKQELTLRQQVPTSQVTSCNIVLIGHGIDEQVKPILRQLSGMPILTVGETTNFVELGGMVDFSTKRVNHFEPLIHLDRMYCSKLQVSSRILKMSKRLIGQKDRSQINCDEILLK